MTSLIVNCDVFNMHRTEYTRHTDISAVVKRKHATSKNVLNKWKDNTEIVLADNIYMNIMELIDRLCGLVVSVEDYKHRGPGFDFRALLRIFLRELGLEWGPLSLVIG
jgi:hypothetical protein